MKNKSIWLIPACLLVLVSCARETDRPVRDGEFSFVAFNADNDATRTVRMDDGSVLWSPGDAIHVFYGSNSWKFTSSNTEPAATATFSGSLDGIVYDDNTSFWALYPYVETDSFASGTLSFTLPQAQNAVAGSFDKDIFPAVATGKGSELAFRNVAGGVKFSVSKAGIKSVAFKGNDAEPLAGAVKVALNQDGIPVVSEVVQPAAEITLSAPAGTTLEPGKWYFAVALPAALPKGYTLTLTYEDDHQETVTSDKAVEIKRSTFGVLTDIDTKVQPAGTTYRISHVWLWGGTGGEYGGTKVIDLLTKPDYWNKEDGRGVTALSDNYFQVGADGSFVNYAGEDGRNWWFVYSGSVNPVDHKDINLRKFYDVLPLSTGQFAIDGTAVTLTKADGTKVQATLVGPGTYEMPDTKPVKSVTIETQALMFTITGGTTSWDPNVMYTDYHAIAGNPRYLYVELEQLPAGFVVPEASRTTDADFKYETPAEPFNWATLPGNWTVYGTNKAPYGIWVLGGSGDKPDFVSPVEKTWDWDDSIYRESDNGLVIKVTGFSATGASGTLNWWAGDDGKFWNYTWKNENYPDYIGTDLSQYYDQIPKGENDFTADLATMSVTLSNGHVAKFLAPGDHTFAYNKTFTVPANCFALAFHLMDPVPANEAYLFKDIDRFMFAPLEYVIIFEKQQ